MGALLVEQVVCAHVVPGDVPGLEHDLGDHVLQETDEHGDLDARERSGGGNDGKIKKYKKIYYFSTKSHRKKSPVDSGDRHK